MFLRCTERKKDGKTHSYWSIVENKRLDDRRVVQRHVLYLGEINSSQAAAWRKAIEVFDVDAGAARAAAEHKVLRDYAENLLAGLLVGIPELYKEMESCN